MQIVKIYLYNIFFEIGNLVSFRDKVMAIEAFQKKLGKQIAALRKKSGLSQTALAHKIDKDRQWLNYIEKGKGNPTVKTLYLIAAELGVDVKHFFELE
ncbi:MAG: helix-turn-helix transcriptional regulator [Chitinophagaceae bacterium]